MLTIELVLMIAPPPCAFIIGATARQPLNTAVTFKSMMFLNAGRVILVERLARGNARVVHQNVDAAKSLGDLRHGGFHRGVIGQVGRKTHDVPIRVFGLELGQRLVHRLLTRAEERDGRAVFEERFHNGKADAAGAAGHDRLLSFKQHEKYASCARPDQKRTSDLYN